MVNVQGSTIQSKDTFASLKKTCRQYGLSFWHYLTDRLTGSGIFPRLSQEIEHAARLLPCGSRTAFLSRYSLCWYGNGSFSDDFDHFCQSYSAFNSLYLSTGEQLVPLNIRLKS
ncbi:hypothetical protein EZMO1_1052 [Endozoicomonas montiporae CL-33]|uniref:Uncharacterized protein n=1 Tax=Endozoicomonas montiporae CL-33 TaxID=570277 RepID=A0A142B932_9GAMM|nr:hypothetical protein EZMO1_1052 [Endozoicomonas montiporae CL-33]